MTLLLLAGTREAHQIAAALADAHISAVAALSGETRLPEPLALLTTEGGFGGEAGFRVFLATNGITAVLDATHPFAERISERTARVCAELHVPYCYMARPEWTPAKGDRWTFVEREEQAIDHIADRAVVFLVTGRQTLERFSNLVGREVICRQIERPTQPFPFPGGRYLQGTPPFSVEDEKTLFTNLGVDWLVVKNAGGEAPRTKLTAARELGLNVLMINRPQPPEGPFVQTVEDALAWVAAL